MVERIGNPSSGESVHYGEPNRNGNAMCSTGAGNRYQTDRKCLVTCNRCLELMKRYLGYKGTEGVCPTKNSRFVFNIKVVACSNPFSWYRWLIGEEFAVEYWPHWGKYMVISRKGRHSDDCTIRLSDAEISEV